VNRNKQRSGRSAKTRSLSRRQIFKGTGDYIYGTSNDTKKILVSSGAYQMPPEIIGLDTKKVFPDGSKIHAIDDEDVDVTENDKTLKISFLSSGKVIKGTLIKEFPPLNISLGDLGGHTWYAYDIGNDFKNIDNTDYEEKLSELEQIDIQRQSNIKQKENERKQKEIKQTKESIISYLTMNPVTDYRDNEIKKLYTELFQLDPNSEDFTDKVNSTHFEDKVKKLAQEAKDELNSKASAKERV
jgi:hypothetical protein